MAPTWAESSETPESGLGFKYKFSNHRFGLDVRVGASISKPLSSEYGTLFKSKARIWPRVQVQIFKPLQIVVVPLESASLEFASHTQIFINGSKIAKFDKRLQDLCL